MKRTRVLAGSLGIAVLITGLVGCTFLNQEPTAAFSVDAATGTVPMTVTFDASDSFDTEDGTLTYTWKFGDGGSAEGQVVSHTFESAGQYVVQLTVTDDQGAKATATTTIIVNPTSDPPTAAFSAAPLSGGTPLVVAFNAAASFDPDGSIVSYEWVFGDGGTATGANVVHTFTSQGTYTATLTVTDNTGQSSSTSVSISVVDGGQGGCV